MAVLAACLPKGGALAAADCAHVGEDESGGPEFHGTKVRERTDR